MDEREHSADGGIYSADYSIDRKGRAGNSRLGFFASLRTRFSSSRSYPWVWPHCGCSGIRPGSVHFS